MPVAHHKLNTLAGEASENLALPAINGDTRNHDKGVNFASEPDVVMITKTENNPRSAKRIIYRSIPPSVQNFTLSDMLDPGPTPKQRVKKKSGHLSGNAPSDFARRFFSRPTTQPKVIEFTTGDASPELKRRGVNGFFPPVKLRVSHKGQHSASSAEPPHSPSRMQFAPTAYSEVRPRSSISRSSRHSTLHMRKTPESIRTAPPMDNVTIYPETFDCGDLSYLPPPKRILPKREVPWVFRYKVKRNMNELSRIMASRPAQLVEA